MSLSGLILWNKLLTGEEDFYGRLKNTLVDQLSPDDFSELIDLANDGDERHKQLAISLLLAMRGRLKSDSRLSPADRERLRALTERFMRAHYPFEPFGASAYQILSQLDTVIAGDFLADELQIDDKWEKPILNRVLGDMLTGSPKSMARLEQLSERSDKLGKAAISYLELAGRISPQKLRDLGAEFRASHTARNLNRLYSAYILHQVNKPIAPIVELLGEPSRTEKSNYIYDAEGIQLYLEQDRNGNLTGVKLK